MSGVSLLTCSALQAENNSHGLSSVVTASQADLNKNFHLED